MIKRPFTVALLLASSVQAQANIDIVFDYTYDTGSFFSVAERKNTLEAAAAVFETRFADNLSAITSYDNGNFDFGKFDINFSDPRDPNNKNANITITNQSLAANAIRIYVGAADIGSSSELGIGGFGGYNISGTSADFVNNAPNRGQGQTTGSGAVDFAPWGGSISFSNNSNWYFGMNENGLGSTQTDFYSVAVHELAHTLGFGIAPSFIAKVSGSNFVGINAGTVALTSDRHWAEGTLSTVNGISQEAAMDPDLTVGTRKYFTELDFAAMQDIGWQVTAVPEADTWAMLLAGLGLIGFVARYRKS